MVVDGGARILYVWQVRADSQHMPWWQHKGGETGGPLGAARLACLAAGNPLAAVCEKPEIFKTWRSDPERHNALMQRYQQFTALYHNDLNYRNQ